MNPIHEASVASAHDECQRVSEFSGKVFALLGISTLDAPEGAFGDIAQLFRDYAAPWREKAREYAKELLFDYLDCHANEHLGGWGAGFGIVAWLSTSTEVGPLTDDEAERLKQLAIDADGWWAEPREFVELQEWMKRCDEMEAAR